MSKYVEHAWHVHHCGSLMELLTEPIEVRREFIRKHKAAEEQETRLRLLQPVCGNKLPDAVLATGAAVNSARAAFDNAKIIFDRAWTEATENNVVEIANSKASVAYSTSWTDWSKTVVAHEKALAAHQSEIETLHAMECPDCPWNGETIFPKGSEG